MARAWRLRQRESAHRRDFRRTHVAANEWLGGRRAGEWRIENPVASVENRPVVVRMLKNEESAG